MKKVQQVFLDFENQTLYAQSEHVLGSVYLQIIERAGPKKLSTMARNIGFILKNAPMATKKAEAHFKKAIAAAGKIGARGILAQAYLDLGRLQKAKKRIDAAWERISEAIKIFEEYEAEGYSSQAKEALATLED